MVRSKRLIVSYVLDWVVIVAIWAAGGGLNFVTPYKRPFSLLDLDISYPYTPESISTITLVIVGLIAPAVVVAIVVLVFVPGFRFGRSLDRSQVVSLKLWELEKGLAGLALGVGTSFFVTQALKNMFGKPRPDLIARCMPDITNIANHVVGGYGQAISPRWTLVSSTLCTNTDSKTLDDGFRSFPSGHSTFSWAGMVYLTLFLCSKLAIWIPHLPVQPYATQSPVKRSNAHELMPYHARSPSPKEDEIALHGTEAAAAATATRRSPMPIRNRAASPPNHLIIIAFFPIAVAFYISSTRYVEFYHAGFDIISGSLIGIVGAYFAFRWYHLPLSRGDGWAWGPRSENRAFGIGVGTGNYVNAETSEDVV